MKYIQERDELGKSHIKKVIPTQLTERDIVLLEIAHQLERIADRFEKL